MTWNSGPCRHWPPGSGQLVVTDEYPHGFWIPDEEIQADEAERFAEEGQGERSRRYVVHNGEDAAVVIEPTGDEVRVTVWSKGLDQYCGESFTLSWRKAGAFAVALLNAAERR